MTYSQATSFPVPLGRYSNRFATLIEKQFIITDGPSVNLSPYNGVLQRWTLTSNRSPTANLFDNGQYMKLRISGNFTITWPSVVWMNTSAGANGTAPAAPSSGWLHVELWKEDDVLYGAVVGYTAT